MRLLDYRDRSAGELAERLIKKSYSEDEVSQVVRDFQEAGLVDDRRFARFFVESKLEAGKGSRYIRMKLKERRISSELADQVLEEVLGDRDEETLCLERALSLCGLSDRFEVDENRQIIRSSGADGDIAESEQDGEIRIGYFEPKDETILQDRRAARAYREKAKAKLARRLISAGFSTSQAFDAVQKIERL